MDPSRRSFRDIADRFRPPAQPLRRQEIMKITLLAGLLVAIVSAMILAHREGSGRPRPSGSGSRPTDRAATELTTTGSADDLVRRLEVMAHAFYDGEHPIDVNARETRDLLRTFWTVVSAEFMARHATSGWDPNVLFDRPGKYRGKILRFRGNLLQARTVPIPEPWEGGPDWAHIGYVQEERSGRTFVVLYLATPDTAPLRGNDVVETPIDLIQEYLEFDGLFLRLYLYERYNPDGRSLVLPAALFAIRAYRPAVPPSPPNTALFAAWVAGGAAILSAAAIAFGILQKRRGDQVPLRSLLAEARRKRRDATP